MTNTVSRIISDDTLSRIIQIESAGKPTAKAPTSSATGLDQFITSTWLAVVRKHRPTWAVGKSDAQILALRTDSKCSIEMLARFTEGNAAYMGAGFTDGDLYLAHFAGAGTVKKLLHASERGRSGRLLVCSHRREPIHPVRQDVRSGPGAGGEQDEGRRRSQLGCGLVDWGEADVAPVVKETVAATTTATTAAAVQQGWSTGSVLLAICITIIVCGAVGAAVHFWPRKAPVKIEGEGADGL